MLARDLFGPSASEDGKPLSKNEIKKRAKDAEKAAKAARRAAIEAEEARVKALKDSQVRRRRRRRSRRRGWGRVSADSSCLPPRQDSASQNYGKLPLHQSAEKDGRERTLLKNISAKNHGETVYFRARVTNTRAQGAAPLLASRDSRRTPS